MLTGWFSDEKIRDNIFLPNDYEVKLNIITHLDANFSEYNGIKNLNDIQYSSALSDGYITENMEQKLLDNLVYSKISDNKVRFQGTISDISAICSSSSSSSSCDFIAYMKLA